MKDMFAEQVAAQGDDDILREILFEVCQTTHMGFAAIARVTEEHWIACQVDDRIGLGLHPGDELEIKQTICDQIREYGRAVVIDEVGTDPEWRTHPVPMFYGFQSYASLPIFLDDGGFYGTLCALDMQPRSLGGSEMVMILSRYAALVGHILSRKIAMEAT